jgi:hypothetical protein
MATEEIKKAQGVVPRRSGRAAVARKRKPDSEEAAAATMALMQAASTGFAMNVTETSSQVIAATDREMDTRPLPQNQPNVVVGLDSPEVQNADMATRLAEEQRAINALLLPLTEKDGGEAPRTAELQRRQTVAANANAVGLQQDNSSEEADIAGEAPPAAAVTTPYSVARGIAAANAIKLLKDADAEASRAKESQQCGGVGQSAGVGQSQLSAASTGDQYLRTRGAMQWKISQILLLCLAVFFAWRFGLFRVSTSDPNPTPVNARNPYLTNFWGNLAGFMKASKAPEKVNDPNIPSQLDSTQPIVGKASESVQPIVQSPQESEMQSRESQPVQSQSKEIESQGRHSSLPVPQESQAVRTSPEASADPPQPSSSDIAPISPSEPATNREESPAEERRRSTARQVGEIMARVLRERREREELENRDLGRRLGEVVAQVLLKSKETETARENLAKEEADARQNLNEGLVSAGIIPADWMAKVSREKEAARELKEREVRIEKEVWEAYAEHQRRSGDVTRVDEGTPSADGNVRSQETGGKEAIAAPSMEAPRVRDSAGEPDKAS